MEPVTRMSEDIKVLVIGTGNMGASHARAYYQLEGFKLVGGVHYVDIMCQMTRSQPIRVQAIGARLSDDIKTDMYNYGQRQVVFQDGSVGWYEAGGGR